ncbi:hypothetical protein [Enterobacter asburiae]|uniref:hypothetical protein n=1 Tax=Enterobacter asburiae TaxID=61645 RepID=UPI001F3A6C69|nr:hypothetical protein [Enterobacter asburiae]BCT18496.1 hypothetical protein R2TS_16680 [Enterobacter asburiae]
MSTITRERVAGIANGEKCYTHDDVVELSRIALASLEAEAVAEVCEGFALRYIGHGPAHKSGVRIGDRLYTAMLHGADGNSPVIPDWQAKAEKLAELYGVSFVVFRNGESPQCADPSKVVISFTEEGLGHGAAAGGQ